MSEASPFGSTANALCSLAATAVGRWRTADRGWRATLGGVAVVAVHVLAQGA